jgi:soluble lytic murein transglycosylase-like protein
MTILALLALIAAQEHVPMPLLAGICEAESNFRPGVIHYEDGQGDSIGLCQIKLKTARWMGYKGNVKGLLDARTNLKYAAKYLRYQLSRYADNTLRACVAYNNGRYQPGRSKRYCRKVFHYAQQYQ